MRCAEYENEDAIRDLERQERRMEDGMRDEMSERTAKTRLAADHSFPDATLTLNNPELDQSNNEAFSVRYFEWDTSCHSI